MEKIIAVEGLKKSFGRLEVLKNVSCDFAAGGVVSILGPNASGKTTLIKSILGMVLPDSGSILFKGKSILNTFDYKRHIGYMPQIGHYPDNMQIGQLFKMVMDIRQQDAVDTDLLKAYQLEGMYHKTMRTLSGGTLQKVSAALAFMFSPDVLILDEPSAGLDPLAADALKEKILAERANGKLVLITSHILSEADEISDHILYLFEGKIKFYKTLPDLKMETGEQKLSRALTQLLSLSSC
ncbi:ABC transporter ATP-binding protein [Mucilaginibacter aquariorum]|uniref:ABC transporter ATP-binding protein n=1 Tax=Mucilaginibacter aquariorum TaxID=2967225 RepID=A0ABT1T4N0_9SPHI|nr:ABC transporter ATP-binding protein [Mucilaginibacter aquariorum]MCQ6959241.1 ABC transporter ATP-binding protein [Mucilaginibacter aquariorum]